MRIVVDTNVLVSALLKRGSPPDHAVFAAITGHVRPLFDDRILAEYRAVLARPKFRFDPRAVLELLAGLTAIGERVDCRPYAAPLPDEGDRPFVEVAVSGRADAIVTGNVRDFPPGLPVPAVSPAQFIANLRGSGAQTSVAQLFLLLAAPADWVSWAGAFGHDLRRAYDECPSGEVVVWMAEKLGASPQELLKARLHSILAVATEARPEHDASRHAIDAAERFERHEAVEEEVIDAIRTAARVNHPAGMRPGVGMMWSLSATNGLIPLAANEDEARRRLAQFAAIVRRTVPFERLPLPARWWATIR